ncbi:hypothetical protein D9M73_171370 [compost metagenome]
MDRPSPSPSRKREGRYARIRQKIRQHRMAMFGGDAFGVELHAVDRQRGMAHAHHRSVIGARVDHQRVRQILDDQRMIARRGERRGQAREHARSVMRDGRGLAVHQPAAHHAAAEMLADCLMPQAHAQQRTPSCGAGRHQIERDAGLGRGFGAGRDQEPLRIAGQRLGGGQRVVAHHLYLRAQLHQVVDQVPGEAVVIVDDEDHGAPLTCLC